MSDKLKALQDQHRDLYASMNELSKKHTADAGWDSKESEDNWNKLNEDVNTCKREISKLDALQVEARKIADTLEIERKEQLRGSNPTGAGFGGKGPDKQSEEVERHLALRGWIRGEHATEAEEQARQKFKLRGEVEISNGSPELHGEITRYNPFYHHAPHAARSRLLSSESRALSAYQFNLGGATVPSELSRTLEVNMLAIGSIRAAATIIQTSGGNPITYPTVDDTGNTGQLLGENVQETSEAEPSFNGITYGAHKYSSKVIKLPRELIEDGSSDVVGLLVGTHIPRRLTDITETHFAQGDGAGKPRGILTDASQGVEAASQTAFLRTEIERLIYSIDPSYRTQPGNGFMMHDTIMAQVRILQDLEGRFNWVNGTDPNLPERLSGYPVFFSQKLPSTMTIGTKVMLFGKLSKYWIRKAGGVVIKRADERFFDSDQVGFVAFERVDAKLMDAGTKPIKYLQLKTS